VENLMLLEVEEMAQVALSLLAQEAHHLLLHLLQLQLKLHTRETSKL
jgi:hypothetical protein